jgi:hypothetical protein
MREGKWVCVRPTWGSASGTHFCQAFSDCAGGALVCGWGLHSRSRASGSRRVLLACLHCSVQKSRGHVLRHVAARLHAAHVLRRVVRGCTRRA